MDDVTNLLGEAHDGNMLARERLLESVYGELRALAGYHFGNERSGHSLQPTALVNEAYLRLLSAGTLQKFENRAHFFAAAAEAMRRILVDAARANSCLKRGGEFRRVDFPAQAQPQTQTSREHRLQDLVLDLDEGIQKLAEQDSVSAELIKLRLFAGLSVSEAGEMLGLSRSTAYRTWEFARSWFSIHFQDLPSSDGSSLEPNRKPGT
jgi:RNA polymerase sigma factor (TIGR02999 family)